LLSYAHHSNPSQTSLKAAGALADILNMSQTLLDDPQTQGANQST
jgi:hypothetical protein